MPRLISALIDWLEADTTLKRIEAQTAELGDYARGRVKRSCCEVKRNG